MQRRDIRLKRFDYRSPGIYLVTLVTEKREHTLGRVTPTGVALSPFGEIARQHLMRLPTRRPSVEVVAHVVMPDHVHLLVRFSALVPAGLGGVVGCLKGGITRDVNLLRRTDGAIFWQHNYWERVIRSERELDHYRRYLQENPVRWFQRHGG